MRECIVCGRLFVPPKGNHKTCSKKCSIEHRKYFNSTKYKNEHTNFENKSLNDKKYYQKNKCRIKRQNKEYHLNRLKTDPNYRMIFRVRQRLYMAVKNKYKSELLIEALGCTMDELRVYLQNTAIENGYIDFDIDDYSGNEYHIDHIKPCSSFNLLDEKEFKECVHYSNLQILDAKTNIEKSNKIAS